MQTLQDEGEVREAVESAFGAGSGPLLSLLRPSLRMAGSDGDPEEAVVRLGGLGVLEASERWPTWNDQPLTFLAAIDCAAVAVRFPESPLPSSGIVTAWVHRGPEYGAPEHLMGGAIVHHAASRLLHIPDGVKVREVEPPGEVADAARSVRFPRLFRDVMWPINLFELESDPRLGLTREHVDFADELVEAHAEVDPGGYDRSRIGGWPTLFNAAKAVALVDAGIVESRGGPDYRADGAEAAMSDADSLWRPLLQLDADLDMGWNWFLASIRSSVIEGAVGRAGGCLVAAWPGALPRKRLMFRRPVDPGVEPVFGCRLSRPCSDGDGVGFGSGVGGQGA